MPGSLLRGAALALFSEACQANLGAARVMTHDDALRRSDDADDLQAINETLQGSPDAFGRIVDRYTPVIYSLEGTYCRSPMMPSPFILRCQSTISAAPTSTFFGSHPRSTQVPAIPVPITSTSNCLSIPYLRGQAPCK